MSDLLRTFVCTPTFDINRRSVTKTIVNDFDAAGIVQLFGRSSRPAYMFDLKLEPMLRYAKEQLESFHAFHQGGKSFMFEGLEYGVVENYQLFSEGDGVSSQFYLPNRWIGANSFSLQTRDQVSQTTSVWATTAYSLIATPGAVIFGATVPSSGHDIEAKYACQYRCVFEPDGIKLEEFARRVWRAEITLREVFIFT